MLFSLIVLCTRGGVGDGAVALVFLAQRGNGALIATYAEEWSSNDTQCPCNCDEYIKVSLDIGSPDACENQYQRKAEVRKDFLAPTGWFGDAFKQVVFFCQWFVSLRQQDFVCRDAMGSDR
jgi:hypothetical protein